ncbi:MAG: hypothetical protein MUC63_05205 [Planctomycetes bacterium]|nr:hypothetical protein [Planctomycetota bacterium]
MGFGIFRRSLPLAAAAVLLALIASPARACGFHSSFLSRKATPRQWWEYHRHEYVAAAKPSQVVTGRENDLEPAAFKERRAATESEDRTLKRRALAATVMQHLMYLNAANVQPSEFPDFKESYIPDYLKSFKEILVEIGSEAVPFLLEAYLNTLAGDEGNMFGMSRNRQFNEDVADVLQRIGKSAVPEIAAFAARHPSDKARETLLGLAARVVKADPDLAFLPGTLNAALPAWKTESPRLLKASREGALSASAKDLLFRVWMAVSFQRGETAALVEALRDRAAPADQRIAVADFLAGKEHLPVAADLLRIARDPEEALQLRQAAVLGVWTLHLLCTGLDREAVKGDLGLKERIAAPGEKTALRILLLYFLANLGDESLLDLLVLVLNRADDDPGVRMAALDAVGRLGLRTRAGLKIDPEVLLRPDALPSFRLGLLDLLGAAADKARAPALVRLLLSDDDPVPLRVRSALLLRPLNFPGYDRALAIARERTRLDAQLAAYLLDPAVSAADRAGVARDLEALAALQVEGLARAAAGPSMRKVALGEASAPPDAREILVRLTIRVEGGRALPLLREVLESPAADPRVKAQVARWAGEARASGLHEALKKAREGSKDPLLSAAVLDALERLGERVDPRDVGALLAPAGGREPDAEVFEIALPLLGRIGDRTAFQHVVRWVQSPSEGPWSVSSLALRVVGAAGEEARPWFQNLWEIFVRTELGDPVCRTAFLECFLRLGPSRDIVETLSDRMRFEIQRAPISQLPPAAGPAAPGVGREVKAFLPPLHAFVLLHAYWKKTTELPDVTQAQQLAADFLAWYFQTGKAAMPKK